MPIQAMPLSMHKVLKTQYRGPERRYDGGKKIKGRKRHIATDIMGNLFYVKVGSANKSDTDIGRNLTYQAFRQYSSVLAFCADQGYLGMTKNFVKKDLKLRMDITKKPQNSVGFKVIKKRWLVE